MSYSINSVSINSALEAAFSGRILKLERMYDVNRIGYNLVLSIFIAEDSTGSPDELEIYRRVSKVVNVVSPVQGD